LRLAMPDCSPSAKHRKHQLQHTRQHSSKNLLQKILKKQ